MCTLQHSSTRTAVPGTYTHSAACDILHLLCVAVFGGSGSGSGGYGGGCAAVVVVIGVIVLLVCCFWGGVVLVVVMLLLSLSFPSFIVVDVAV